MIRSSLCDYSAAYIHVKETITIQNAGTAVIFKNCAPFTNCMNKIKNALVDDANYIDVLMPIYNSIEYSDIYSKTCYGDEPALDNNNNIIDFPANNDSILFKFKEKITGQTGNDGTEDVEVLVQLKFLNNFWRTLKILFINFEINLQLKCSAIFF